jgi:hypothetical protein
VFTRLRKGLLVGAISTAAVIGGVAALSSGVAASAADPDVPPPLEEDYSYPGADRILAEHGIKLIKGNGGIRFVECPQNLDGILRLESDSLDDFVCFKVINARGYLTMQVDAKSMRGDGKNELTATVDGKPPIVIKKTGYTPLLGDLIELRVRPAANS